MDEVKKQLAINIAMRKKDGKVECDTVYRDVMFTKDELVKFCDKHDCDILAVPVGYITFLTDEEVKKQSLNVTPTVSFRRVAECVQK